MGFIGGTGCSLVSACCILFCVLDGQCATILLACFPQGLFNAGRCQLLPAPDPDDTIRAAIIQGMLIIAARNEDLLVKLRRPAFGGLHLV